MPFPMENEGSTPEDHIGRRAGADARSFAIFLAGSIAVHGAGLVALPGFFKERVHVPPRVLEVALVQAEPPPQAVEEPSPPSPQPRRRTPERVVKAPLLPEPPRRVDVPAPVLSLPENRSQAEPSFAIPSPKPAEARPAPAEPRTEVASIAVTPPSFSAAYLRNPAPRYPPAARQNGVQGTVTLRVLVTRDGFPARVEVDRSSGSAHLDNAALDTVKTWRFTPARRGAELVEEQVLIPIVFRLEGAG
jgi:protein TonB